LVTQPPITEFYTDNLHRHIYATDASVYRILPHAVAYPKNTNEIKKLIDYANKNGLAIIPRAAGTSLGGQCVGDGIIVDISKYFTEILDFNLKDKTVKVQPGVIRDQLNDFLKPHGLFFGPNTSTSNRCNIGGMVGNNSSGTTSIQYGVTRDKVLALTSILSDGSEVIFKDITKAEIKNKIKENTLEGNIYNKLYNKLLNSTIQEEIRKEFPKKSIHRRNNGYALDALLETNLFTASNTNFNISKLLSGSEGTLAFTTEIVLSLDDLPPKKSIVIGAHFKSISEALRAVVVSMKHNLYMCELMDKIILDQTKSNRTQAANRSFIVGDPEALLLLKVSADSYASVNQLADSLIKDLQKNNMGYAFPKLKGKNINKATDIRSAGLGLLGSIIGDNKSVACIEDTAVALADLPQYIEDFDKLMKPYKQKFIYYAHAGAGELHLRPILNLKKSSDVRLFQDITEKVAHLVKKYKGSLSGEHGDGIVRASFLPFMVGDKNYELLREIKYTFDPNNLFNKGKIIDSLPTTKNLRYTPDRDEPTIDTIYNFTDSLGILRATEKCNGSGDCRKLQSSGGTMCPSYKATRNEKDTTRARANALREFLTHSNKPNRFNHKELYDVFDLCLSCKACASECPSNVDVATLKAEFLYQYQKENGIPFRSKLFAYNASLNKLGSLLPGVTNFLLNTKTIKKLVGIAEERSIPKLAKITFARWLKDQPTDKPVTKGELLLFLDEYTNFYDVTTGQDAYKLFTSLGYRVKTISHAESGRAYISKGLLDKAKEIANENVDIFKNIVSKELPLVGIEPSTILSFKDEYIRLADNQKDAKKIAKHTYTVESFFEREIENGMLTADNFSDLSLDIKIHGHCHQRSLDGMEASFAMLNLPINFKATILDTSCCGMAGAFGYEKEHYSLSMQVGEGSVFPTLRKLKENSIVVAAGTSCRHKILDGTQRKTLHPVSVLKMALKNPA
jgi:FAD/FMN-containing dehydrogenase/Fe-S oxidoreductase